MRHLVAISVLLSLVAAAPARSHEAIVPPGTPEEEKSRYAYQRGTYASAERAPMVWFEHGFPGASGNADNPYKAAFGRAVHTWNRLGRDFRFRIANYDEVTASYPYRFLSETKYGMSQAELNDDDYKRWCGETRDDPTQPGLNPVALNLIYWSDPPNRTGPVPYGEVVECHRYPKGAPTWEPYKFAIAFRAEPSGWWAWPGRRKASGRAMSSQQMDFQAVATHELGHATGFAAHFPEGPVKTTDCDNSSTDPGRMCRPADCSANLRSRETMCQGSPKIGQDTIYLRTLGSHDKHTFLGAYPPAP